MQPSGPLDARVMIVGEAPGYHEEQQGVPFVGPSGHLLNSLLHDAGLQRSQCFVTNVCRVRPPKNAIEEFFVPTKRMPHGEGWTSFMGGWAKAPVVDGHKALMAEIDAVKPKVIIALGNLALRALTGNWGILKWRGSELPGPHGSVIVPTIHPALILREWSYKALAAHDLRRAARWQHLGYVEPPPMSFKVRPSFEDVTSRLNTLLEECEHDRVVLACDLETRAGHIACVGLAWSPTEAISIPLMCIERPSGYWELSEELTILDLLVRLLEHKNVRIIGQNFSYDAQYLWRWLKCLPRLALDTMVTHHVCFPGTDKDLATLSSLYCDRHVFWKDEGKEWEAKMDEDQLWRYNCVDAVRTFEVGEALVKVVKSLGLEDQCVFQHHIWWLALKTMIQGVRRDAEEASRLAATLDAWEREREELLQELLGHPLNVRSTPQMRALFYEDLGLPPVFDRKSGSLTLDDEALDKLAAKEPLIRPVVKAIRELRSVSVFRSTFVEAKPDRDGRFRCSYNVAGTETFRFSSSKNAFGSGLNLQNIPKGGSDEPDELDLPNVRRLFIPDPGYEIFDMDLDSADLRIVVWESDCQEMKAMLREGKKVYVEIAKEYYRDPTITKHHPKYGAFKSLCHGTNYLGSARGIAPRVGLLVSEVERIQQWYYGRFPEIRKWQERLKDTVRRTHTVSNVFGFRRFYFDRIDESTFRQAAAWVPQSTIGLLINHIWLRIFEELPDVQILLQVHDSLVGQYPIEKRDKIRPLLKTVSLIPLPYPDRPTIPTGLKTSSKSWGDCEDEPKV